AQLTTTSCHRRPTCILTIPLSPPPRPTLFPYTTLFRSAFFFGSPFAVLVTAAGAAAIPVIIHLLNRKRFRVVPWAAIRFLLAARSEEHTSELQSLAYLVCRLLLEKKKLKNRQHTQLHDS